MNAIAKSQIPQIADRFASVFERHKKRPLEVLPTGVAEIDRVLHGFPRGAITEIHGAVSCGRTSLLVSALAVATSNEETCALVDCSNTFDLESSARAEVNFDRLLWIRCKNNLENAFKAVDLLLHAGGFGFIALNLADMPAKTLRRIISTWWFRFRRAIENTPAVLIVTTPIACVRSCAAVTLNLKNARAVWHETDGFIATEEKYALMTNGKRAPHLSLVHYDRYAIRSAASHHACLLQGLTVRVDRERPLEWPDRTIHFTAFV